MRINNLYGFIIPWILGLKLIQKDKNLLLKMFPFIALMSTLINFWGRYNKFWILKPRLRKRRYLTTMPFNIGLFPILGTTMVYIIRSSKLHPSFWYVLNSLLTTGLEFSYKSLGRVVYGNGWNLFKTFISYLISNYSTYRYYLWLYK